MSLATATRALSKSIASTGEANIAALGNRTVKMRTSSISLRGVQADGQTLNTGTVWVRPAGETIYTHKITPNQYGLPWDYDRAAIDYTRADQIEFYVESANDSLSVTYSEHLGLGGSNTLKKSITKSIATSGEANAEQVTTVPFKMRAASILLRGVSSKGQTNNAGFIWARRVGETVWTHRVPPGPLGIKWDYDDGTLDHYFADQIEFYVETGGDSLTITYNTSGLYDGN